MENKAQSAGLFNYTVGNQPNVLMLFVGYCCCCGLSGIIQLHNIRNELKRIFPQINDSNHWLYVIIGLWGIYVTNNELAELEKEYGIVYTPKVPVLLLIFLPVLWPIALGDMMSRLNALAEKRGE